MNINDYLRQFYTADEDGWSHDMDFELLLDFEKSRKGRLTDREATAAAKNMWEAIAAGDASVEQTLRWAQHVARAIEANVIGKDNKVSRDAAPAALKAIGFRGQADDLRPVREFMATLGAFPVIDENGQAKRAPRLTAEEWLIRLQEAGFFLGVEKSPKTKKTAINRINDIRNELGIG